MVFSRVVQVRDSHSKTTPTTHPRNVDQQRDERRDLQPRAVLPEPSSDLGAVPA